MTALLALVLVLVALGVTLYPLRRAASGILGLGPPRLRELEERYRAAMADLTDIELDREVGNLEEPDYEALRARYRHRAAATLSEISLEREVRTRLAASLGSSLPTNGAVTGRGERVEPTPSTSSRPGRRLFAWSGSGPSWVLAPAAALALAAAGGIVALYWSLVAQQATQEPLAHLQLGHAHTVRVEADGAYWVGHHDGLLSSVDGRQWRTAAPRGDVMAIADLPSGGGRVLLGHDVFLLSRDGGASWMAVEHDLPGTDVHGAQALGAYLYAYVMGFGVFRTQDAARWEWLGPGVTGGVSALAALEGPPPVLFVVADGRALRSPDGGRTWSDSAGAGNLALTGAVRAMAADPIRRVLYAATSDGLFHSNPGGTQWNRLPLRATVAAVGVREQTVAVVDDQGRFFLSRDGGVTWAGR